MTKTQIRTAAFLRILRERYGDSPVEFERQTGYPANMVSQIKGGYKKVGEKVAVTLEDAMGVAHGTLERDESPVFRPSHETHGDWPLSVPRDVYESLSPRLRKELDEAFTRMVMGAQSQELLQKQQAKLKRG